ncbi:MAG TPA: putative metal-dependent hydrolase [Acidobacteriaceae bacterium]|jgi:hypothetical protein
MSESTVDPRYPIGTFTAPSPITPEHRTEAIQVIEALPQRLREAVEGLSDEQLHRPYRAGGWMVVQLVHHIGDSHATALHRLKRALTEDWPEIHGYQESLFATLADATGPIKPSLNIIEGVHTQWVTLLRAMDDAAWAGGFRHNERGPMTVDHATQLYAWHSKHHVAHITRLRETKGW